MGKRHKLVDKYAHAQWWVDTTSAGGWKFTAAETSSTGRTRHVTLPTPLTIVTVRAPLTNEGEPLSAGIRITSSVNRTHTILLMANMDVAQCLLTVTARRDLKAKQKDNTRACE